MDTGVFDIKKMQGSINFLLNWFALILQQMHEFNIIKCNTLINKYLRASLIFLTTFPLDAKFSGFNVYIL